MLSALRVVRSLWMVLLLAGFSGCTALDKVEQQTTIDETPQIVKEIMAANSDQRWEHDRANHMWIVRNAPRPLFPLTRTDVEDLQEPLSDFVTYDDSKKVYYISNHKASHDPQPLELSEIQAQGCPEDPTGDPNGDYEVWQAAWLGFPTPPSGTYWKQILAKTVLYGDGYHTYNMLYASCRTDLRDKYGWTLRPLHMQNLDGFYIENYSSPRYCTGYSFYQSTCDYEFEASFLNAKDNPGWAVYMQAFGDTGYSWGLGDSLCSIGTSYTATHKAILQPNGSNKYLQLTSQCRSDYSFTLTYYPSGGTISAFGEIYDGDLGETGDRPDGFRLWAEWEDNKCPSNNRLAWKSDKYSNYGTQKNTKFQEMQLLSSGGTTYYYSGYTPYVANAYQTGADAQCNWATPGISAASNYFYISW